MNDCEYWLTPMVQWNHVRFELYRIEMRGRRKPCGARLQEEGRHALNKIRRAVCMKIVLNDNKRCNIPAVRKRLKTVSQRRGVDKTKSF
ncbi:hypothetical protein E2C01_031743 [Portunus trituberculatus]|uniref:Uncharacterized protein n=1 Tax=Portunus trituberculatus TaxID=210409 RepID=A0A5B7EYZ7_PORTR|nr:hypothetical protein [Portunus trituberculatus]